VFIICNSGAVAAGETPPMQAISNVAPLFVIGGQCQALS
jgi:hypothetical protein